jgi:hypothetical protein
MMRGNTVHHRHWLALNEARHRMCWKWAEFFIVISLPGQSARDS